MRSDTPSFTARWVAGMRGLGSYLPERLRLVDDPYGLRFSQAVGPLLQVPAVAAGARATAPLWMQGYVRRFALYMQLRTRVIDDDVEDFVRSGGKQIVLLGAGFDARAWRLAGLSSATVFEVDHPATQQTKRARMAGEATRGKVVFVPWDFEHESIRDLPARLIAEGQDPAIPTMTVLEGVVMYLSGPALDATFAAIAAYSAPGSPLSVTYLKSELMQRYAPLQRARRAVVRWVGEPFRTGFEPARFESWLSARDFRLERDESAGEAARRLLGLGARRSRRVQPLSRFALARRI
ncbi:MAG TPA: SAM-dependent methyltransferase [Polyangiaceae bacterium]|nr:SAM-dependent methyltransferase [Polyangiaceae bacterium]